MNIGLLWKPDSRPFFSRAAEPAIRIRGMRRRLFSTFPARAFALPLAMVFSLLVVAATAANLKTVQVRDAAGSRYFYTFRTNPISILKQYGIHLSSYDRYDFTPFSHNRALIDLHKAFPVTVADGKASAVRTILIAKGTVANALATAGVQLGGDDLVNFPLSQDVYSDMKIVVNRVTFRTVTQTQPIGHKINAQTTSNLKKGTTQVVSQGRDGEITTTLKQKYIDGKMAGQEIVGESVTIQPADGTMLVGTAVDPPAGSGRSGRAASSGRSSLAGRGSSMRYSRVIETIATGYSPVDGTATATGRTATVGCVAVDPDMIPLGSRLYITSSDGSFVYGYAVAADTGGFSHNGSGVGVDLFFASAQQAGQFGRQSVKVYVLS